LTFDTATESALNPDYNFRENDRWGCYKPNDTAFPNTDNPYVIQDKTQTDIHAAVWSLRTIQLPSGGLIKVDLESDDYAYVQDKRATRMFKVEGFSETLNTSGSYSSDLVSGINKNHLYMYVSAPDVNSAEEFRKHYIGEGNDEIKDLYYKFLIDITGSSDYEYIPGYAPIDDVGWSNGVGWIKIKPTSVRDNGNGANVHPITKTALQFIRIQLPDYVMGRNPENTIAPINLLYEIVGLVGDAITMIAGANRVMRDRGMGRTVNLSKSFIRLQTPNYKKLGGGVRVNQITIDDRWGSMSGNDAGDFDYGQTYDYDMIAEDATSSIPVGDTISSGVAVYEPFIGNEENPLRQPVAYSEDRKMAPDSDFYQETPYGEMFYPSPSVGYSQIRVTNLSRENVSRTATGYIVHKFYTAKDFPVKVKGMNLDRKPKRPNFLRQIFKLNVRDYMTVSQSHAIELNDMHGKPKAQYVYAEGKPEAISSVEYFYKENANTLNNEITVIDKEGKVSTARAGVEIDMTIDERESTNYTSSAFLPFNLDISLIPLPIPPPVSIPSTWPKASNEEVRFRSIANTKVITRYGILEKTVAQDLGSYVSTENLAWDKETGEVLLTRTQNDFEDPVYAFTYPAHWGYDGMGQAYRNIGAITELNLGTVTPTGAITNLENYFAQGDELLLLGNLGRPRAWVTNITPGSNGAITLQNRDGNALSAFRSPIILRSGRRNQQGTPIGSVTTLSNPIQGTNLVFTDVINAGAVEFKHEWTGFCECDSLLVSANPYVNAQQGNYRPLRSHAFLTERDQSQVNANTYIREDGTFEVFDPFWTPNNGQDWDVNQGQWTFASEVTLVSPYGLELEIEMLSDATHRQTINTIIHCPPQ